MNEIIGDYELKSTDRRPLVARVNGLVHDNDHSALITLARQLFKDRTKDMKNFNMSMDFLENLFKVSSIQNC